MEDGYGYEIPVSSSQPPKAKRRRLKTLKKVRLFKLR